MWNGAILGLSQGIVSIGLDYLTEELDIDPLLANIGFSVIANLIQSGLTGLMNPDDNRNIFERMFDTFKGNVATFLGYQTTPNRNDKKYWDLSEDGTASIFNEDNYNAAWANYYWQEAAYTSQILDFSEIIQEKGFVEALNVYAKGFFNSTAINAIVTSGKTIGEYFLDELNLIPDTVEEKIIELKDNDGNVCSKAKFRKNEYGEWELVGKIENNVETDGNLSVDALGNLVYYSDAELKEVFGDYTILQTIENGQQAYVEVLDWDGNEIELQRCSMRYSRKWSNNRSNIFNPRNSSGHNRPWKYWCV